MGLKIINDSINLNRWFDILGKANKMKYLDLEIYKDFNCIGSECPFSCCGGGWRIIIDDTTDKFYQAVDG